MTYKVNFTDGALGDLRAAQAWYENKVSGLGARITELALRQAKSLEHKPDVYANQIPRLIAGV